MYTLQLVPLAVTCISQVHPDADLSSIDKSIPSYVWRSILASQHLVCNGSVRRIGRGETVSIWKDPWLPNVGQSKILTPVWNGLEDAKVCSLMVSDKMEWDLEILKDLFIEADVQQILKIPLSSSRTDDSWLWIEGGKGVYSVKSAYRSLCQDYSNAPSLGVAFNWLKLWSLSVPPKAKNFIWRAMQNCLPSLDNLRRRFVEVYPLCPVCQEALENTEHIMFACSFAQNCWKIAKVDCFSNLNSSFQDTMLGLFQSKSCSWSWRLFVL